MDNRYRDNGYQPGEYGRSEGRGWQQDQYVQGSNRQQGDDWGGAESVISERNRFDRGATQPRDSYGERDAGRSSYARSENAFGYDHSARSGARPLDTHNYVSSSNYGSDAYRSRQDAPRYGSGYGSNLGRGGSVIPPRQFDRDERGFFDRASDEVMSWFGDDEATRRRQMDAAVDHRGKGPKGYVRSSERILEDVNERLMHDREVDASGISVTCADCEVTLDGSVSSRYEKRRAEEIVDDISGVKHVQNNLRVSAGDTYYGTETDTPKA